jgi:hypothetical protein
MGEDAGGDVQLARGFASDERRKPGERHVHRRLQEIAAVEFPLRPRRNA